MNDSFLKKNAIRFDLFSFPAIFIFFLLFIDLNPIYSIIIALICGGLLTLYCRPDLKRKMFGSALIFSLSYFVYFLTLIIAYQNYVESVWNLKAISGIFILGVPLEELVFAFGVGFLWSGIYEHAKWRKVIDLEKAKF